VPWNPTQYLAFGDHRLRPALDLLARIRLDRPARVVDLGCGPGNVTKLLAERWPDGRVTGIDNSPEMLDKARAIAGIDWQLADAAQWAPESPADVLFSNATLHWLEDHRQLFPRLAGCVAAAGFFAVQMPNNFAAPSHTTAIDLARERPWRARLEPHLLVAPLLAREAYYRLLAPLAREVDVWETDYLQPLAGDNPVAEWTKGSFLVPLLAALEEPERGEFEAEYRARVAAAYPKQPDGKTLLAYKRLFIVAQMR